MKKIIPLFVLLLWSGLVHAEIETSHIVVYGTAERQVQPDELHWNIWITTKGLDVPELSKQHSDTMTQVIKFLRDSEIIQESLKTSQMSLEKNWIYPNGKRELDGYYAFTHISFRTGDFSIYEETWTDLSEFKGISLEVNYGVSERIRINNEVRIEALQAAKKKADMMANALDSKALEPIKIEEIQGNHGPVYRNVVSREEGGSNSESSIVPGLEAITSRVKVVFRLAPK